MFRRAKAWQLFTSQGVGYAGHSEAPETIGRQHQDGHDLFCLGSGQFLDNECQHGPFVNGLRSVKVPSPSIVCATSVATQPTGYSATSFPGQAQPIAHNGT